jgi:hypothetical protein
VTESLLFSIDKVSEFNANVENTGWPKSNENARFFCLGQTIPDLRHISG